jgi:hypothetical protein
VPLHSFTTKYGDNDVYVAAMLAFRSLCLILSIIKKERRRKNWEQGILLIVCNKCEVVKVKRFTKRTLTGGVRRKIVDNIVVSWRMRTKSFNWNRNQQLRITTIGWSISGLNHLSKCKHFCHRAVLNCQLINWRVCNLKN